jgi:hypothetical protein
VTRRALLARLIGVGAVPGDAQPDRRTDVDDFEPDEEAEITEATV